MVLQLPFLVLSFLFHHAPSLKVGSTDFVFFSTCINCLPPPRSTAKASDATRQGSGDHPKLNSVTAGMAGGKLSFRHDPLRQRRPA
jgi:hypothetical protein